MTEQQDDETITYDPEEAKEPKTLKIEWETLKAILEGLVDPRTKRLIEILKEDEGTHIHTWTHDIEEIVEVKDQHLGVKIHFEIYPVRRKISKREGILVPKTDIDLVKLNEPDCRSIVIQVLEEMDSE